MSWDRSFSGVAMRNLIDRKLAGDGRAFADGRFEVPLASVQFDKRLPQRQAEPGAAMPRAVGMTFEPVEHLTLDVGWNAWSAIGDGEDDIVFGAPGAQRDHRIRRREPDGVCEQIIQHLPPAAS